jgi:hypothetical protein
MGHASPETTAVYVRRRNQALEDDLAQRERELSALAAATQRRQQRIERCRDMSRYQVRKTFTTIFGQIFSANSDKFMLICLARAPSHSLASNAISRRGFGSGT